MIQVSGCVALERQNAQLTGMVRLWERACNTLKKPWRGAADHCLQCDFTAALWGQFVKSSVWKILTWKKEKKTHILYKSQCYFLFRGKDSHKAQPNPVHVNMFYSVHFLLLWTDIWRQPSKKCFVSMIIRNFKPLSAFGQHHTVLFLCHFTSWCDVLFSSAVIPALHLQLSPFN